MPYFFMIPCFNQLVLLATVAVKLRFSTILIQTTYLQTSISHKKYIQWKFII